jgi:formamidopyrimidine-DNA glycosylase
MPELPEVENVRRTLEAMVIGQRVVAVELRRGDVVTGDRKHAARMLVYERIMQIKRHGKQLAIIGEPTAVGVHLGMTGSMRVELPGDSSGPGPGNPGLKASAWGAVDKHTHVIWRFESGVTAGFRDPRRFGGVWVHDTFEQLVAERWKQLGPDALLATADQLADALAGSRRPIKAALLDQFVIAGLGNIYVDELLFQAGLNPLTHAVKLKRVHVERLVELMRPLLQRAIESGGSTLRDYADARGQAGGFQHLHQVYGRGGEACVTCGATLKSIVLAGRTTVFCGGCQARKPWV